MLQAAASTPKQTLTVTALYYLSFVMLGLFTSSLGPTLPYLAGNVGASLQAASILFAARSFGYMMGALVGSRLYDKISGHTLIGCVLLGMSAVLAAIPFVALLWLLAISMFLLGALESTLDTGANTLLVWLHREKVGPFMNGLHFMFGIGAFLVPIVVAQATLHLGSPGWAYWLLALLPLPLILIFMRLPSPESETPPKDQTSKNQTAADLSPAISPLVWLIAVFFFFYAGVEIAFGNWIYSYAFSVGIANEVTANYLTSAFWGAFTLGRLFTVPLALKLKPRQLLWLCQAGAAVSLLPMLFAPLNTVLMWVGSIGLGVSIAAVFPTMISLAERNMKIEGRTMGIFFVGVSLGAMVIPWLIGQFFEQVPYLMLLIVTASLIFSTIALMLILGRIKRHQPVTQG
jgi:MFS transporter, FHS family, Na+ dependent glucose transporter 1